MGKLNFAGSAICSPAAGEAFAERESFPSCWASFRRARIVPQLLGKLSRSANRSPATGQAFAGVRIVPQLLGELSQGFESFPSSWASFRRGTNRSPVAGQTFVALSRKNYQSVFISNE